MHERILKFDGAPKASGLNPEEVAKHCLAVQIFNPESKKYMRFVESFAKQPENESNFVCAEDSDIGGGKVFLLENIGNNEYYIKSADDNNRKETGFLYVSENTSSGMIEPSANVLRSKSIAFKEELYKFEFIKHGEQNGVYKIRCKGNGKLLYVSNDRSNQVRADQRDREKSNSVWFQLSLRQRRDVKVSDGEQYSFLTSEEPAVYMDEVFNKSKYTFKQRIQARESCEMEKLSTDENARMRVDKELNALSSNFSPFTLDPGKKLILATSTCVKFYERKREVEINGNQFEAYLVCSVDDRTVATKGRDINETNKD